MTLKELKTHVSYEQKRILCATHDLFFVDDSILPLLPRLLGKHFFIKKKQPIPLNFKKSITDQVQQALVSTVMFKSKGVCTAIKFGSGSLSVDKNLDNFNSVLKYVKKKLPGGWENVQSIYLKTNSSVAFPIYNHLQ